MPTGGASKRAWPGLVPAVRRFFFGAAGAPKAKRYSETSTPTTSRYYEGMNESYRWFRQDDLVRRCILTGAFFATMTARFETALEARGDSDPDDYVHIKERIDGFNKRVNLDLARAAKRRGEEYQGHNESAQQGRRPSASILYHKGFFAHLLKLFPRYLTLNSL